MVVPDKSSQEHMLCHWVRAQNLKTVEQGLAEFNDAKALFEQTSTFPLNAPLGPGGHPMKAVSGGKTYYYFARPFPIKRVLADYDHAKDLSTYEGFSCLKPGTEWLKDKSQINRDSSGN